MDFEQEIDQILKVIPRDRRTQLFSATMTNKVQKLQRACLVKPVKVGYVSETMSEWYNYLSSLTSDGSSPAG